METSFTPQRTNPMKFASYFSKYFSYWWLNGLFRLGSKRPLRNEDLFEPMSDDQTKRLTDKLERLWKEEKEAAHKKRRDPQLMRAFIRFLGCHFALLGFYAFGEEGMRIIQPLFIGKLVTYFVPGSTTTKGEAYIYASIIAVLSFCLATLHHPLFLHTYRHGLRLRIAAASLVYRKAMRLSHSAYATVTTGHIINLVTSDVQILEKLTVFLHQFWICPTLLLGAAIIAWYEIGIWSVPGVAMVCLLAPFQGWLGKKFAILRRKTATLTDKRFRIMNEVISGMRVIKMYTWEMPFAKLVADVRREEVKAIRHAAYLRSLNATLYSMCIPLISLSMFVPYALTGHTLTPEAVYTVLGLFYSLRVSLTIFLPECVRTMKEGMVSSSRLQAFLEKEDKPAMKGVRQLSLMESPKVKVNNISAKWNQWISTPTLQGIRFELKPSDLLMVVGPVGAGKSSLLMCLLGELPLTSGTIDMQGRLSYASQQAWIFSGSVRDNVLFGQKFDEEKYKSVIKACAMERDLALFPNGDETLVGEKGVALSGGQRARINLARSVYFDADIVLLDDPLSAVDTLVGRQLFDECIRGILKDRICILVTHQLQFLKGATDILCLQEGKCVGQGTYGELTDAGLDVMSLLSVSSAIQSDNTPTDVIDLHGNKPHNPVCNGATQAGYRPISQSIAGHDYRDDMDEELVCTRRSQADLARELSVQSLAEPVEEVLSNEPSKEEQHTGTVTWQVYLDYFKAGARPFNRFMIVLLLLGSQTVVMVGEWWLASWADSEKRRAVYAEASLRSNSTLPRLDDLSTDTYILVYAGLICTGLVSCLFCAMLLFNIFVTASQTLHNNMFSRVLKAPIYFFDTNPVGRVVNRFAKDISQMDDVLPAAMYDFLRLSLLTFAIVLLNVASMPYLLGAALPMIALFGYIRNYYLKTSREVKRLEAINRSPVYSHLSTSLTGLTTIRAFHAEQSFIENYNTFTDYHTGSYFVFLTTQRWLGFRLDMICAIFLALATFTGLFVVESGFAISASIVGLCVTYAKQLTGMFQWCIRQSAEVENNMTSVERVIEYARINQEEEASKPLTTPDCWPKAGTIVAEMLTYAHHKSLPAVLKDINFSIKDGEKIGIVGRTGAGKSSLLAVLFRLNNPQGLVRIDELPITDLCLHDLRSAISIIPQDPVLFSGSLQNNLDPFMHFSEEALWDALEEVQLKEAIEELPDGLETQLAEGGSNFSVGQRQLVCLARAILSHNKILVIDEATANVDQSTDTLIQETIRNKFQDCTVLTIAHRLNTIMDSDRVMVLDGGCLVEFDEPHILLLDSRGCFTKLVEQTGTKTAANLRESARQAYELRHDYAGDQNICHGNNETGNNEREQSNNSVESEKSEGTIKSDVTKKPVEGSVPDVTNDSDQVSSSPDNENMPYNKESAHSSDTGAHSSNNKDSKNTQARGNDTDEIPKESLGEDGDANSVIPIIERNTGIPVTNGVPAITNIPDEAIEEESERTPLV